MENNCRNDETKVSGREDEELDEIRDWWMVDVDPENIEDELFTTGGTVGGGGGARHFDECERWMDCCDWWCPFIVWLKFGETHLDQSQWSKRKSSHLISDEIFSLVHQTSIFHHHFKVFQIHSLDSSFSYS